MKKNKKILIAALALVLVICSGAGGAYAMLHATTNKAENKFSHGVVNITIQEDFKNTPDEDGYYLKQVKVKNDSLNSQLRIVDCYAAVRLVLTWVDENGNVFPIDSSLLDKKVTLYMAKDVPGYGTDWEKRDGVYYYTKVLKPDEESSQLMAYVKVDSTQLPEGGHLEMNVLAQSVLTGNEENYVRAWENAKK